MKKLSIILLFVLVASVLSAQSASDHFSLLSTDAIYNKPLYLPKARRFSPHQLTVSINGNYSYLSYENSLDGIPGKQGMNPLGVGLGLEYAYFFTPGFGLSLGANTSMLVNDLNYGTENKYSYSSAFAQSRLLYNSASASIPSHVLHQNVSSGFSESYSSLYLNVPLLLKFSFPLSSSARMGFNLGAEANIRLAELTQLNGTMQRYLVEASVTSSVPSIDDNLGDVAGVATGTGEFTGNRVPSGNLSGGTLARYGLSGVVGIQFTFDINRHNAILLGFDGKVGLMNIGKTGIGDFDRYFDFKNHNENWVGTNGYGGVMTTSAVGKVTPINIGVRVGYVFNIGKSRSERRHDRARSEYLSARSERRVFLLDSLASVAEGGDANRLSSLAQQQADASKNTISERSRQIIGVNAASEVERVETDTTQVELLDVNEYGLRRYNVVIASLTSKKAAAKLKVELDKAGYQCIIVQNSRGSHYRVVVSTYSSREEAMTELKKIRSRYTPRFDDAWILDRDNKELF